MARSSQTETAVLGVLSVAPMTGYAVREAVRDVLGHFWSESFGQIYPALTRLETEGLVTRPGPGAEYSLTDAGLARLRHVLASPVQPSTPRNGLLLRLFFGRHLGADACRGLVRDARAAAAGQLAGYEAIRAELATEPDGDADHPYWLLTVSAGEHAARATIAWADEALAALDAIEEAAR
ncbi:MAG TPA: PadR family transcriptional regulator [Candidatus Limnocylindrales bacterium]|nr:PadR family transcriptional regulator [Candidatus Limnocylindrales bacterium]